MKTENTKRMIAVMQAFVDGKTIQAKESDGVWEDWDIPHEPLWNWNVVDYRIKPGEDKEDQAEDKGFNPLKAVNDAVDRIMEQFKSKVNDMLDDHILTEEECKAANKAFVSINSVIEKEKPKLMTHRQLAEWLAKGNGQLRIMGNCETFTYFSYFFTSSLSDTAEVCDSYLIRSWDSDDWVEPTVDIYERDCKGNQGKISSIWQTGVPTKFGEYLVCCAPKAGHLWMYMYNQIAHYSDLMGIARPCFWIGEVGKDSFENISDSVVAWQKIEPYKESE